MDLISDSDEEDFGFEKDDDSGSNTSVSRTTNEENDEDVDVRVSRRRNQLSQTLSSESGYSSSEQGEHSSTDLYAYPYPTSSDDSWASLDSDECLQKIMVKMPANMLASQQKVVAKSRSPSLSPSQYSDHGEESVIEHECDEAAMDTKHISRVMDKFLDIVESFELVVLCENSNFSVPTELFINATRKKHTKEQEPMDSNDNDNNNNDNTNDGNDNNSNNDSENTNTNKSGNGGEFFPTKTNGLIEQASTVPAVTPSPLQSSDDDDDADADESGSDAGKMKASVRDFDSNSNNNNNNNNNNNSNNNNSNTESEDIPKYEQVAGVSLRVQRQGYDESKVIKSKSTKVLFHKTQQITPTQSTLLCLSSLSTFHLKEIKEREREQNLKNVPEYTYQICLCACWTKRKRERLKKANRKGDKHRTRNRNVFEKVSSQPTPLTSYKALSCKTLLLHDAGSNSNNNSNSSAGSVKEQQLPNTQPSQGGHRRRPKHTKESHKEHGKSQSAAIKIGDQIYVKRKGVAVVRYIDTTSSGSKKVLFGVELLNEDAIGEHDGTVNGKRLFQCPPQKGLLLTRHDFKPLHDVSKHNKKERNHALLFGNIVGDVFAERLKVARVENEERVKKLGPRDIGRVKQGWKGGDDEYGLDAHDDQSDFLQERLVSRNNSTQTWPSRYWQKRGWKGAEYNIDDNNDRGLLDERIPVPKKKKDPPAANPPKARSRNIRIQGISHKHLQSGPITSSQKLMQSRREMQKPKTMTPRASPSAREKDQRSRPNEQKTSSAKKPTKTDNRQSSTQNASHSVSNTSKNASQESTTPQNTKPADVREKKFGIYVYVYRFIYILFFCSVCHKKKGPRERKQNEKRQKVKKLNETEDSRDFLAERFLKPRSMTTESAVKAKTPRVTRVKRGEQNIEEK
ncbi:hypothetical protein RFI_26181 [Reticulomyxa filosa]|uniref:CAP-Gly domain-containing protein n=1 Tax=Reticulomyxa filosa TaxID=46433 RepID=X6MDS7_RETFI|nr:hypothetical protein RFI_26181 [Reticulomyxa filosa]|eukprot:ETO11195.1 hypothetical protein RFI_26181 [Reticulomyxa filosa]